MVKLAVITSTRAEYGLLRPLIEKLLKEPEFEVHVLVSGTHLLEKFGNTIQFIQKDNIPIAYEIPIFEEDFVSDEIGTTNAVAEAVRQCGEIFSRERYNAIIVLGDRYELLGFCMAAVMCRIPIVHIHGGEITEGAIDDKIRHAITKLASVHFPSISEYASRIIQMGEDPEKVFTVGALGIDNILNLPLLDGKTLYRDLEINTKLPIAAVTFHPVTSEDSSMALGEIRNVLDAIIESRLFAIVTMPNSDVGGDIIFKEIVRYTQMYPDNLVIKKSLGQLRYLSLLRCADIMVGNSSSGILESASFRLPTVDIGSRQKGRMAPDNVIHCECEKKAIVQAITKGLSREFKLSLEGYESPYGDGCTAERMVEILKSIDFNDIGLICKKFYKVG